MKKIMNNKYSYHNNRGNCSSTILANGIEDFTVFCKFYAVQVDGYYWAFEIVGDNDKLVKQLFISDNENELTFTIANGIPGTPGRIYRSGITLFGETHDFLTIKKR